MGIELGISDLGMLGCNRHRTESLTTVQLSGSVPRALALSVGCLAGHASLFGNGVNHEHDTAVGICRFSNVCPHFLLMSNLSEALRFGHFCLALAGDTTHWL